MINPQSEFQIHRMEVESFVIKVSKKLDCVPQVKESCDWMQTNLEKLTEVIRAYVDLSTKLDCYGSLELKWIQRAHEQMQQQELQESSASKLRADTFLLSSVAKDSLSATSFRTTALQAFNPKHTHYDDALSQLANMMYQGHLLYADGKIPKDGDSASDNVIWGHTQAKEDVDPRVLAHFIICHYLARFFSFVHSTTELADNKDAFLAVLTDAILLEGSRDAEADNVLSIWLSPREEGGLGWLLQGQLDAYQHTSGYV